MKELSLFSGAGGGLLGTKLLGWEHIGYVEFNKYCQKVIRARIDDGILDPAPIFTDVREFIESGCADQYRGFVDVVTAGFPCQPFSVAGKQQGEDDPRNMWPQTIDIIRRVRPRFALLENVPGLLAHGYARRIFGDLAESGFDVRWRVLSAAEVGAPHKRDRLWIVAHSINSANSTRREPAHQTSVIPEEHRQTGCAGVLVGAGCHSKVLANTESQSSNVGNHNGKNCRCEASEPGNRSCKDHISNSDNSRCETGSNDAGREKGSDITRRSERPEVADSNLRRCGQLNTTTEPERTRQFTGCANEARGGVWWATEPDVGRVVNGVANRVDRLRALGNGQVSRVASTAWRLLTDEFFDG